MLHRNSFLGKFMRLYDYRDADFQRITKMPSFSLSNFHITKKPGHYSKLKWKTKEKKGAFKEFQLKNCVSLINLSIEICI